MRKHTVELNERELRVILTAFDYCGSVKTRYRTVRDVKPMDVRKWRTRPDVSALYQRLVELP